MTREESIRIDTIATAVGGCQEGIKQLGERMDRSDAERTEYHRETWAKMDAMAAKQDAMHADISHARGWISLGKALMAATASFGAIAIALWTYLWPPKGH